MKEKTKEFLKKNLIGFILGVVSAGTIIVYAETYFPSNDVTYDNKESGLTSTNVQGAIDELYGVCFPSAGDQIIEEAGLEKDPYECRYFFTGANPNNYITFNNEQAGWRILSVECDGRIKIQKNQDINSNNTISWSNTKTNNWANASLNTYLNETYFKSLSSTAQAQIINSNFSTGEISINNNDLATQINDENSRLWNGKVALITVSEYIRANSNKNSCGSLSLNNNDYFNCRNTNWLFPIYQNKYTFTITPYKDGSFSSADPYLSIIMLSTPTDGGNIGTSLPAMEYYNIFPTIYLSPDIKITGGTGTSSDPYEISL